MIVNTNNYQAGGVRVKSVTDKADTFSSPFVKTYTYLTHDGLPSGSLMQMPRYWIPVSFIMHTTYMGEMYFYAMNPSLDLFTVDRYLYLSIISPCSINTLSRDNIVLYSHVQEKFPDNSYVEYEFTGWDDFPDVYASGPQEFINKILPQSYDIISSPVDTMKNGLSNLIAGPVYEGEDKDRASLSARGRRV